jgi:spoIIIJ-associated protein
MASLEIEAKSIEEAIENACSQFNVTREQLTIEILNSGSTGIFGIVGSKKARIRATINEEPAEPVQAVSVEPSPEAPGEEGLLREKNPADEAHVALQNILTMMGLDVSLQIRQEKETLYIRIEGDKSGLLIGRRGQTLDALQYLLTRILNKRGSDKTKVVLDSGEYRNRRKKYLENLALKMAEKSKKTGKPVVISPLNAHDRRIIHLTLEKDKTLKTVSRGEGQMKKMIISGVKRELPPESPSEPET